MHIYWSRSPSSRSHWLLLHGASYISIRSFCVVDSKRIVDYFSAWLIKINSTQTFTFSFMHLADAFIQSDLQLHSGYTFSLVHVLPGNRTHNLLCCWCNALPLSHTNTFFFFFFFEIILYNILYVLYFIWYRYLNIILYNLLYNHQWVLLLCNGIFNTVAIQEG